MGAKSFKKLKLHSVYRIIVTSLGTWLREKVRSLFTKLANSPRTCTNYTAVREALTMKHR